MASNEEPLDEKAKRMRDLLSSFYTPDHQQSNQNSNSKYATLDTINTNTFDADQYMNLLVQKSNMEQLLKRHVEMAAEIKNLDTDLQMLVYENYNKFISATDTIKRMNGNIVGMETNMEQLLDKIKSVQSRSDNVNTSLFEKREHIEKLHRTRNLIRKVQFIYDLPTRLAKCIKSEAYADAVKFYTGAMPIFKAYGDSSFQDCKRTSEEAMAVITKNLQGKLFSDSESIQARAEAAVLLKQLDFPVDNLKAKLLEKLEQFLVDLELSYGSGSVHMNQSPEQEKNSESGPTVSHEASVREFAEAVRAYRVIFPDSGKQLIKLSQDLVTKHFEAAQRYMDKHISSTDLLTILKAIWKDVLLMDEVLPGAELSDYSLEAGKVAVKEYISGKFSSQLHNISEALTKLQSRQKEGAEAEYSLQDALEASKKAVLQGSVDVLQEFRQLLDDNLELVIKIKDLIVDWVQEGFQHFFRRLDDHFLFFCGKKYSARKDQGSTEGMQSDKIPAGLVLVLAQLSVFIEQTAIPRITEEIAASFSGGGVRGYEYGPAFVPGEICRTFRTASEMFLNLYINMRTQKVSILLRKRFTTPNWVKHKEPREVHMFVDLLLKELEGVKAEVKQILPQGNNRRHRRTDSSGSTTSSRSNPLRETNRSNSQKARSHILETHLAKLFKQKVEIFTKVEFLQDSVLTAIVKLSLKSLQEFVRLQTFNRSGFQQIQLDIQFLRIPLKEVVEDEAAIDFLLDEVIVSAAERSLDPVPLEIPILDKLIQAKLDKSKEQNAT